MSNDADRVRELLNNNKVADALALARKLAKANPADLKARALMLEALFTRGEHAAVDAELAELARSHPQHPEVARMRTRFKKR